MHCSSTPAAACVMVRVASNILWIPTDSVGYAQNRPGSCPTESQSKGKEARAIRTEGSPASHGEEGRGTGACAWGKCDSLPQMCVRKTASPHSSMSETPRLERRRREQKNWQLCGSKAN